MLSHVRLLATPWTAACQASLSITNSRSLLRLMSIEPVMPSNHLILCLPLLLPPSIFPSIRVFSNELVPLIGSQSIGASASASVLPMNIQGWFSLGWTGWISMLSKELSRVFSSSPLFIHQPISLARLEVPQVTGMGLVTTLDYPIVYCTCYTCLLDKEINEWMIFEKNISGSFTLAGKINEHALSL